MEMTIYEAVRSLRPKCQYVIRNGELEWHDEHQDAPTGDEISEEIIRLQTEWDATEYQRSRKPEYPPLADLADALYWQAQGDETKMTAYLAAVDAVKQKYPKGV